MSFYNYYKYNGPNYLPLRELQLGDSLQAILFQKNFGLDPSYPYEPIPQNVTLLDAKGSSLNYSPTISGIHYYLTAFPGLNDSDLYLTSVSDPTGLPAGLFVLWDGTKFILVSQATPTYFILTIDNTPTIIYTKTILPNVCYGFDCLLIANSVTTLDSAIYKFNTRVQSGGLHIIYNNQDNGLNGIVISDQIIGNQYNILVTGLIGNVINWKLLINEINTSPPDVTTLNNTPVNISNINLINDTAYLIYSNLILCDVNNVDFGIFNFYNRALNNNTDNISSYNNLSNNQYSYNISNGGNNFLIDVVGNNNIVNWKINNKIISTNVPTITTNDNIPKQLYNLVTNLNTAYLLDGYLVLYNIITGEYGIIKFIVRVKQFLNNTLPISFGLSYQYNNLDASLNNITISELFNNNQYQIMATGNNDSIKWTLNIDLLNLN